MIEVTKEDIGRAVSYISRGADNRSRFEYGIITSYNTHYVFVRYDDELISKATHREDLLYVY